MFRLLKYCFVLVLVLGVAVLALGVSVLEDRPRVDEMTPPTPKEVEQARYFVRGLRDAINPDDPGPSQFVTNTAEMNSLAKLGSRVLPGVRGRVVADQRELKLSASLPVRVPGGMKWVNVDLIVPPFEGQVAPSEVRIGRFLVPPDLALWIGRAGANLFVGSGFGDRIVTSASGMRIEPDRLVFAMTMDRMGSNGIMRGMFGSIRGAEMPDQQDIARYYTKIRRAMDDGTLPKSGSYLPYVIFALETALEGSAVDGPQNAYTSSIFALSLVCGAFDFGLIVGGLTDDTLLYAEDWVTRCDNLLFNGRVDSRRHFTTAAAIQAASNRGFAVSVGEFKELYDSRSGGFDFTDIAANNSGIRMSDLFMSTPVEGWPALISRIQSENDVIVPFAGIPSIMSEAAFNASFGDVDSPQYRAQLARIEDRIDRIALHQ